MEAENVSDKSSRKRKLSPTSIVSSPSSKILKTETEECIKPNDSLLTVDQEKPVASTHSPLDVASTSVVPGDNSRERKTDGHKHQRKRTKFLIQAVLDQVEFYFSDSNLSKDRFLKQLLDKNKDGYIDLTVFGNFNKLQQLHRDGVSCAILKKALKRSKMLKLSDDGTKVSRITPFKEISKEECDRRTIYVENLPSKATHAWVRTLFSQCGKVVYVSLPKFKTTKDIKGFAFVEFETAEEASKACLLNNPPPEKLEEKPGRFPKFNKTLSRLNKLVPGGIEQPVLEEDNISDDPKSSTSFEQIKKKKKKKGKKKKTVESASEEKLGSGNAPASENDAQEVKKKKKKKKKKRTSLDDDAIKGDPESNNEDDLRVSEKDESLNENEVSGELKNDITDDDCMQTDQKETLEKEDNYSSGQTMHEDENVLKDKESNDESKSDGDALIPKKKKRKKKKKGEMKPDNEETMDQQKENIDDDVKKEDPPDKMLSRKERKRLRQEDIRRKKREREGKDLEGEVSNIADNPEPRDCLRSISLSSQCTDSETEDKKLKQDGSQVTSILKSKRQGGNKKVEFDPVPVTKEYVKVKDARRRKRLKKEKVHLRIISKKEWDNLRAEYIKQQKSHMTALKESLRELKQQECKGQDETKGSVPRHVDLEDVFGTKRLKPSHDVKLAHVEALQFTPNVIVQWKIAHAMHREKIRNLVNTLGSDLSDRIAYIDSEEEAKSGYIRFKDEESAEIFTRSSRNSDFISARLLPADQQQAYWDKANQDRMKRLGRKKKEKGSEKLARKVFERNKETFLKKPNRIVFADDAEENSIERRVIEDFEEFESNSGNKDGDLNSDYKEAESSSGNKDYEMNSHYKEAESSSGNKDISLANESIPSPDNESALLIKHSPG